MTKLSDFNIKIFADGADSDNFNSVAHTCFVDGYTYNPSLMRAAGVTDYMQFIKNVSKATDRPVSFEVFADDFDEMGRQAKKIAATSDNIYVKIPITNTKRQTSHSLIERLSNSGIKLNITAIMTADQVAMIEPYLRKEIPAIVSIFAGRIADTGRDPTSIIKECRWILEGKPNVELLWASCREVLNIYQAEESGCDIITVPENILNKLHLWGKDLGEYSQETVQMFYDDAKAAKYWLLGD